MAAPDSRAAQTKSPRQRLSRVTRKEIVPGLQHSAINVQNTHHGQAGIEVLFTKYDFIAEDVDDILDVGIGRTMQ